MNKIFVPPIKSQGIKTKLVPWIMRVLQFDQNGTWIEPFMGTGVVGFNVRPKNALFSDLNPHIINFYNAIKRSQITARLARRFLETEGDALAKEGMDYYYEVRDRFNRNNDPLDFLFLSRSCFNGMIRFNSKGGFNVPFCHKRDRFSKSYITKIVNQIEYVHKAIQVNNWQFECGDFRQLIKDATSRDFIYCDPPYFGRHVDYYNSWAEEDERDLFLCLRSSKAKFILSTWHSNPFRHNISVEKYWRNFTLLTKDHFYHVGAKEKNRNPVKEALVINYRPAEAAQERTYARKPEQMALLEKPVRFPLTKGVKRPS
jgi:DNA adenine methylase